MSKSLFASTIIDKLNAAIGRMGNSYSEGTAFSAMDALAQGITEYLIQNTIVTVQYTGVIPAVAPVPDPVTTDTFKIVGQCAPTGPSNHFNEWIRQLEANIIAGFQLAPSGELGVVFAQKPFLTPGIITLREQLTAIHDVLDEDPQYKVWEVICGGIMDWINTIAMNPASSAASRPSAPSSGTAVITKITIT